MYLAVTEHFITDRLECQGDRQAICADFINWQSEGSLSDPETPHLRKSAELNKQFNFLALTEKQSCLYLAARPLRKTPQTL